MEEQRPNHREGERGSVRIEGPNSLAALEREAEEKRLLLRLEELADEIYRQTGNSKTVSLETLLSLLWVEEGKARLSTACVLCGYSPQRGMDTPPPPGPARLCQRLERAQPVEELLSPPLPGRPSGNGINERIGQAVLATLTHSLDILKAELRASRPEAPHLREEAEVCLNMLHIADRMGVESAVDPCLRLLNLFPPEQARASGPQGRLTARLREAAARTLGSLSPDSLFAFWYALGSPDSHLRHNLLQVLDYLTDPRAVPYLVRLLERRTQWTDGDMTGWFVIRAMEHIGDRSALPALRRIAAGGASPLQETPMREGERKSSVSAELVREAERVILSIEGRKNRRESASLLRAAHLSPTDLLRPAVEALEESESQDREELLRPEDSL